MTPDDGYYRREGRSRPAILPKQIVVQSVDRSCIWLKNSQVAAQCFLKNSLTFQWLCSVHPVVVLVSEQLRIVPNSHITITPQETITLPIAALNNEPDLYVIIYKDVLTVLDKHGVWGFTPFRFGRDGEGLSRTQCVISWIRPSTMSKHRELIYLRSGILRRAPAVNNP